MQRDKHLCQTCLRKNVVTPAREVDHVTPKAKGGTDDLMNLAAICTPCHRDKSIIDAGGKVRPTTGNDGWPID